MAKIGKYNILGQLGVGSMGVVYKAEDPEIGRTVAIKTIKGLKDSPELLERFRIEARSVGNLKHPNIITLFEVNTEADEPYMVMDYIDGVTLGSVLDAVGSLGQSHTLYYAEQIASALDAVHKKDVLHKDIKPANVMISNDHHIYVLDFGVATVSSYFTGNNEDKNALMGTPGYMSPEQILNKDLDYKSDLFSFAIVLYQMLSGKRPFKGKNYKEAFQCIVKDEPTSITEYGTFPLSLDAVFCKALSKDKEQRYPTAKEFVKAAKEALEISDISEPEKPLRELSVAIRRQTKEMKVSDFLDAGAPKELKDLFGDYNENNLTPDLIKTTWYKAYSFVFKEAKIIVTLLVCLLLAFGIIYYSPKKEVTNDIVVNEINIEPEQVKRKIISKSNLEDSRNKTVDELLGLLIIKDDNESALITSLEELARRSYSIDIEKLRELTEHSSHIVRLKAIKYCVVVDPKKYKEFIVKGINDYDPLVRMNTVEYINDSKDNSFKYELEKRASIEKIPQVQMKLKELLTN